MELTILENSMTYLSVGFLAGIILVAVASALIHHHN